MAKKQPIVDQRGLAFQKTIQDRWEEYKAKNPQLFERFVAEALSLKRSGVKHCGAKAIFEHMRYEHLRTTKENGYSVNNDFSSRAAIDAVRQYPELEGFFEHRGLRAA